MKCIVVKITIKLKNGQVYVIVVTIWFPVSKTIEQAVKDDMPRILAAYAPEIAHEEYEIVSIAEVGEPTN